MTSGSDLIGQKIGRVRVESLLGEGGMGKVYRGFDEKLERPVAIKAKSVPRGAGTRIHRSLLRTAPAVNRIRI